MLSNRSTLLGRRFSAAFRTMGVNSGSTAHSVLVLVSMVCVWQIFVMQWRGLTPGDSFFISKGPLLTFPLQSSMRHARAGTRRCSKLSNGGRKRHRWLSSLVDPSNRGSSLMPTPPWPPVQLNSMDKPEPRHPMTKANSLRIFFMLSRCVRPPQWNGVTMLLITHGDIPKVTS